MNHRLSRTTISLLLTASAMVLASNFAAAQAPLEKLPVAYAVIAPTQATV